MDSIMHAYAVELFSAVLALCGYLVATLFALRGRVSALEKFLANMPHPDAIPRRDELAEISERLAVLCTQVNALPTAEQVGRLDSRLTGIETKLDSIGHIVDRHERWLDEGRTDG